MTKQQTQASVVAAVSTGLIVALTLIVYYNSTKINISVGHASNLPAYSVVEKNFATDTAIISVKTKSGYTNKMRELTKYLIESQVEESHSAAIIYYYAETGDYRIDEPLHMFVWKKNRGVAMQY